MLTPDRLSELKRQRALLLQQLAALDREIQAFQAGQPAAPRSIEPPPVVPAMSSTLIAPLTAIPNEEAEAIIGQYSTDEKSLKTNIRRGCFLYAAGAFALLVFGVFGLYLLLRH
jgi:hypothetical protein